MINLFSEKIFIPQHHIHCIYTYADLEEKAEYEDMQLTSFTYVAELLKGLIFFS